MATRIESAIRHVATSEVITLRLLASRMPPQIFRLKPMVSNVRESSVGVVHRLRRAAAEWDMTIRRLCLSQNHVDEQLHCLPKPIKQLVNFNTELVIPPVDINGSESVWIGNSRCSYQRYERYLSMFCSSGAGIEWVQGSRGARGCGQTTVGACL